MRFLFPGVSKRKYCRMISIETYIMDTKIISAEGLYHRLLTNMPAYRQEKIRSYIFAKDRLLSLGACVLLAYSLASHGVLEHKDVQLGDNGKPYLSDCLHYNISHSGSKVACSFSVMPCASQNAAIPRAGC